MPWSGGTFSRTNGTYTGATVWAQDAAAAVKIQSSRHDTHDQDLAAGINNCLAKDGTNSPTANIPMNSKKFTSLAAGSSTTDSARFGQTITAASINAVSNVLTLTRADGNITVDLTAIVVGASYGNLANKTLNETITGSWDFGNNVTIRQGNIDIGASATGSYTGIRITYEDDGFTAVIKNIQGGNHGTGGFEYGALKLRFDAALDNAITFENTASVGEKRVWWEGNFDPDDKSDVGHTHSIDALSGVYIASPADGHILQYSSGSGGWVNRELAELAGVVSTVTATGPVVAGGTATDVVISVPLASGSTAGLMSSADFSKLASLNATPVNSFNGRTGTVVPTAGDYTIQQISNVIVNGSGPGGGDPDGTLWFRTGSAGTRAIYAIVSGALQRLTAFF